MKSTHAGRTFALTAVTMTAFAANSLLCREALESGGIDPISFTTIRLVSGALILAPLARPRPAGSRRGSVRSALALFAYAIAFSLAYVELEAGTGALILFAAVQATMIVAGIVAGERPRPLQWLGFVAASGGLVYLVLPGIAAPDPYGAGLMVVAGVAWGFYSLRGRGASAPVSATAGNFLLSVPAALAASAIAWGTGHVELRGVLLAVASGALASGLGYVVWYVTLPRLTATTAAIVQLSVPVIAACGGIVFLGERASWRLAAASVLILGGVAAAIVARPRR